MGEGRGEGLSAFLFALLLLFALPATAAEVHGSSDTFTAAGVKLAWAIARGPDEASTIVVVRLLTGPGIDALTVTGRDPFTNASKLLQRAAISNGRAEVRIPRSTFADYPRTEWKFAGTQEPLTVFYLGIPDTTPEFADEAKLDSYLEARLAKLR